MRLLAAIAALSFMVPLHAWADEKAECVSAHEEGQLARRDGRFDRAREAFAACQADGCPAVLRSRCAEFARELETAQPSIVVIVRDDEGQDAAGASVRVDGAPPVDVSAMGVRLDPGSHALRVEAAGFRPVERTVNLPEGFKDLPAIFLLQRLSLPSGGPVAGPKPATAAWAFAIGSGVSLAGAAALSGVGWAMHTNLKSSCGATGCSESQVEPVRDLWAAGFAALGVAVVAAVVATVLFATHSRAPARSALALVPPGAGSSF
jgi:hypothetical protein